MAIITDVDYEKTACSIYSRYWPKTGKMRATRPPNRPVIAFCNTTCKFAAFAGLICSRSFVHAGSLQQSLRVSVPLPLSRLNDLARFLASRLPFSTNETN